MANMAIIIIAMVHIAMARRADFPAIAIASIVALFGGTIAFLSLRAALIAMSVEPTLNMLRTGQGAHRKQIIEAADHSLRAARVIEPGRYLSDASLALSHLDDSDRRLSLDGQPMIVVVDRALGAAPASPHNWVRRAQLQLDVNNVEAARRSLETSMLVGRFVPGLTVPRLRVALALLLRSPDASLERLFEEQVRIAARTEPGRLAAFADGGSAEGRVQRILSTDFRLYNAYLKALIALRGKKAQAEKMQ